MLTYLLSMPLSGQTSELNPSGLENSHTVWMSYNYLCA